MKKTAIALFNLGGPDSLEAVEPFLRNLFSDPAIIQLPSPFRQVLARFIASRRREKASDIYRKIGGRSPIVPNTEMQARALEKELVDIGEVKCFIAMRYWHPLVEQTVIDVKKFAPDEIILLPLYPQFSTATSASSLNSWHDAAKRAGLSKNMRTICCYPTETGFIEAMARSVTPRYETAKAYGVPRILFSAHGLPEKIIKQGDPYQYQCEKTVATLVQKLGIDELDYSLCYQSRVGPLKWIGPSTEEEITRAGRDGKPIIIVPIAFVCENSETLFEIDMLYRDLAKKSAVPHFDRAPTVDASPEFIAGLARLVRNVTGNQEQKKICPKEFCGCGFPS